MARVCDNKIALVTGAAGGIGRASALALAAAGARVMVADVADCAETVAIITAAGGEARSLKVNVADEQQVQHMVEATVAAFGRLDIAFNNAGVAGVFTNTHDYPSDDWARVIAINLTGVWHCMHDRSRPAGRRRLRRPLSGRFFHHPTTE